MAQLSMLELAERFDPNQPLIPPLLREKRERRLRKLEVPFFPTAGAASSWDYMVDCLKLAEIDASDPLARLRHAILNTPKQSKFFVTGHKGAGKSTRLNALATDEAVCKAYHVVTLSVNDYLNVDRASTDQLIAVLIGDVVEEIQAFKGEAEAGKLLQKQAVNGLKRELKKSLPGLQLDSLNINLFGVLSANFKESENVRAAIGKYTKGHPSELPDLLDQLLDLLELAAEKEPLIIIDDLDKLGGSGKETPARNFFAEDLPALLRPRTRMVYTYPIGLERNPEFSGLKAQTRRFEIRHIRLFSDRLYREFTADGIKVMTVFVERRLGTLMAHYLDTALLPALFFYSCGNFRELARLLHNGFTAAAYQELGRFDESCLRASLRILRGDYNPILYSHRATLKKVAAAEDEDIEDARLGPLLDTLAVAEFPNDPGWLDVHPIVGDLLNGNHSPREGLPTLPLP